MWQFQECVDDSIHAAIDKLMPHISQVGPYGGEWLKIATSNQSRGLARAVLIFTGVGRGYFPLERPTGSKWAVHYFSTDTDYSDMYTQVVNALNTLKLPDERTLTQSQAYYSLVTMTNEHKQNAVMALYWRL
jgi:hypothetical protein